MYFVALCDYRSELKKKVLHFAEKLDDDDDDDDDDPQAKATNTSDSDSAGIYFTASEGTTATALE